VVRVGSAYMEAMLGSVVACAADPTLENPMQDPEVRACFRACCFRASSGASIAM